MPSAKVSNIVSLWERVLDASWPDVPPEQVAKLLGLKFGKTDVARVRSLGERAQDGTLTRAERAELDDYVFVGNVLGTLRAVVRQRLGCEKPPRQQPPVPKLTGQPRRKAS